MTTRSLNKVQLIGNLTRDPELRYTPQGTAVCTFGLATNRSWTTESGERREETEFHRIVVWNKLAELCSQLLFKGRRVFVEGRLQTRTWTAQDGAQRQTTEIVIEDMIILDSRRAPGEEVVSEAPAIEPVPQKTGEIPVEPPVEVIPTLEETASPEPQVGVQVGSEEPTATTKTKKKKGEKKSGEKAEEAGEITGETKPGNTDNEEEVKPDDIPF